MKGGKINKVSTYKELRLRNNVVVVQTDDVQTVSSLMSGWHSLANTVSPTMPFLLSTYDKRNVVQADLDW